MRRKTQKEMKKERTTYIYLVWVLVSYYEL